jgi:Ran GTPase-activating protein (RanGAP) involved in mRNA processing and transport
MSSLVLLSCFVNPSIKRLSYVNNYGRTTFKKTFAELTKENPAKWTEVNFQASFLQVEVMEGMTKYFSQRIIKLNISGNGVSMNGCRVLNLWLLKQQYIKDLNMSRCKLVNQGARYIIDAINRNISIRHLNLSHNDF